MYVISNVLFNSAIVAIEAVIFAWFQQSSDASGIDRCTAQDDQCSQEAILVQTIPIYLALFLFAGVYQVVISMWALNQRNTIQLLFLVFFSLAMLVYSGIQYDQIGGSELIPKFENVFISREQASNFLIAVPCIIAGECIINGFLTYKLYKEFNWDIFKKLGADLKLKLALRDYLFFESLIIFDIFFFVGFTLQFIILVLQAKDVEFGLTIGVIPITIVILISAIFSVRKEFKAGVITFIILCFPGMAYFLFKLIRLYTAEAGPRKERFNRAHKTLTVFAVITIVFLILTVIYAIKTMLNFGKGLKDRNKFSTKNILYPDMENAMDMVPLETDSGHKEYQGPRMVID